MVWAFNSVWGKDPERSDVKPANQSACHICNNVGYFKTKCPLKKKMRRWQPNMIWRERRSQHMSKDKHKMWKGKKF